MWGTKLVLNVLDTASGTLAIAMETAHTPPPVDCCRDAYSCGIMPWATCVVLEALKKARGQVHFDVRLHRGLKRSTRAKVSQLASIEFVFSSV